MPIFTDTVAQKSIDEKIVHYEGLIRALKEERNQFCAVNLLPDDVFSLIFVTYKIEMESKRPWIRLLSVCRKWRQIILDIPSFWSTISLNDSSFIDVLLERSGNSPLSLDFPLSRPCWGVDFESVSNKLLDQSKRTREMSISLSRHTDSHGRLSHIIQESRSREFPVLRTLKVESASQAQRQHSFTLHKSIWFPGLNSLHNLQLLYILLPFDDIPHFPSLTSLLIYYDANTSDGLTCSKVAEFLRHTPNIQSINFGDIDSGRLTFTGPQIMAPKLQQFVASFHSVKESRLLHYLEFSNATITNFTLSFAPHARYDAVIDFSYLESFLLRLLPNSQHIPVRRMRVRIQNNSQILIEVFPHGQRSDAFLSLSIPFINSAAQSYLQLFHKLPLARIPELVFDALIPLKLLSGSVCQLPEELLQSAPWSSLRSLKLINIPLPPDVPHLPLLSSAVVGDFPHGDDQLSVHWVTQFLRNTPNVESGSFGGISGNNSSNVPETFSVILPKLRELHIVSHDLAGSKLFSYLDFPNMATICSVHLNQSKCTEATNLSPYEKLFKKMAIGERSGISEMRLSIDDQSHRHEFTLELYCADDGPKPSMEVSFPWEKSSTSLFHQLLSRLPLSRIEKLRISDISQRSTASQWSPFIRLLTNLRELTLDSAIDDTLAVLMPDPNVTGSGSHSNPNLQCLIDHNSEWYFPTITPGHVNILDVFRRRREIGLPIERYIIQCGSIPRNMLEDLQKVVQVELDSETRVTADWSPD